MRMSVLRCLKGVCGKCRIYNKRIQTMTKTTFYILAILILASCTESAFDTSRSASLSTRYLTVSETSLHFPNSESTRMLNVSADKTPWTLNVPANWVRATPDNGSSSEVVNFNVMLNNSADTSRVCVATLASSSSDWQCSYPITITQEKQAPYITSDVSQLTINGTEQEQTIPLSSNVQYTVSNTAEDWLYVVAMHPDGITFKVDANNTDGDRDCILTLTSKSSTVVTKQFQIIQKRAGITSTMRSVNFDFNSASNNIVVESEAPWTSTAPDWIEVSPSTGNAGRSTVTLSVSKNASENERNGSVYFMVASSNCIDIPVHQDGIILNLSVSSLSFDSYAGSQDFYVNSNTSWKIVSQPEWLSLGRTSGNGNGSIDASVVENNTTISKTGKIIISTTDNVASREITVTQSAKTIDYINASLSFGYNAEEQTFTFITNGNWTAITDADWYTIDKSSGSGSATIKVITQDNNTTSERDGIITLCIADKNFNVGIHQACKYLTLSSSAFNFTSATGSTTVTIGSNTEWKASVQDSPSWLLVTPASGSGNATITIDVLKNYTSNRRTGVVQIEIPNVQTYLINIIQAGQYITADQTSLDFTSAGGQQSFTVSTDGTYEIGVTRTWLGYVQSGNIITVVCAPNSTSVSRSGSIVLRMTGLTSGSKSLVIPVTQSSASTADTKETGIVVELK